MIYRQAEGADAAALSQFATRVFLESFAQQLPRSELESFATPRFAPEKLRDEMEHEDAVYLGLEHGIIGYAQVALGNRPGCTLAGDSPAELKRIYVDGPWHGRGVGQQLLHLVEQHAVAGGCDVLWLAVWDQNARGRAFYDKYDFSIVGSDTFQVGGLALQHYYMAKSLRDLS